ncbi:hypothetical protein [Pseudomonas sp. S36]|uniref:hypothetical protein n=1 Tax=Pseudomonas sp. S36 TaxID=2767447 RepID=UPI001F2797F8|nr:hypothetical protein [Pseudomonas sp. S36]MBK4989448.1 hypothetical protein [Pseudomonas sp. S36]
MNISVTIDSCAWNFFFDNRLDLSVELPPEKFSLFITREVEIELLQIPDISKDGVDKLPLKQFIRSSIDQHKVETTCVFGFAEANAPDEPVRYGGFNQGTFESDIEQNWRQREETQRFLRQGQAKLRKDTALRKNEADVSLAVASMACVLITVDEKKGAPARKKGPIYDAAINGGFVVFAQDVESSGLALADYIERKFAVVEGALQRRIAV